MSREFSLKPFEAGKPLLPQVTADRMNAILDGVARNRVEFGDNITGQRTPGGTILRANAKSGGGSSVHAFQVSPASKDGQATIAVHPGLILSHVPYIGTNPASASNTLPVPPVDFSVWLMTRVANAANNYHPRIDVALPGEATPEPGEEPEEGDYVPVKPPYESCYLTTVAPALADQIDFRIKWDAGTAADPGADPPTPGTDILAGVFPVRIADVKVEQAAGKYTIKTITQHVFQSWRTLILVGDDLVPLC
jgi:hypothetical protein